MPPLLLLKFIFWGEGKSSQPLELQQWCCLHVIVRRLIEDIVLLSHLDSGRLPTLPVFPSACCIAPFTWTHLYSVDARSD